MSHLNYFEPFASKPKTHEDQLTRAFLVLLRYSPLTLAIFLEVLGESCRDLARKQGANEEIDRLLPSITRLDLGAAEFNTQVKGIADKEINAVLSAILTDKEFEPTEKVRPSERTAIYDGVITLGADLALIIENKLHSEHIWEEQLSPSKNDLPEGADLIPYPAVVAWKTVITHLGGTLGMQAIGGAERLMINDFLDFVNSNFSFLNPFHRLSLCSGNRDLLLKRTENLLKSVAVSTDKVRKHQGWQAWCIETGLREIKLVGLTVDDLRDSEFTLTVNLYFGDTLNQARAFFEKRVPYSKLEALREEGWEIVDNFHVSFMQSHLVWLKCPKGAVGKYYDYWAGNQDGIKQYDKQGLSQLVSKLEEEGIAALDKGVTAELAKKVYDTQRGPMFNICPSLGLLYRIPGPEAIALDDSDRLGPMIARLIGEGIGVTGADASKIVMDGPRTEGRASK